MDARLNAIQTAENKDHSSKTCRSDCIHAHVITSSASVHLHINFSYTLNSLKLRPLRNLTPNLHYRSPWGPFDWKTKAMASQSMFVLTQAQFSTHSSRICELIHLGRKITLVCGAGVSTAAGISVSPEAVIYVLNYPFSKLIASLIDFFSIVN